MRANKRRWSAQLAGWSGLSAINPKIYLIALKKNVCAYYTVMLVNNSKRKQQKIMNIKVFYNKQK